MRDRSVGHVFWLPQYTYQEQEAEIEDVGRKPRHEEHWQISASGIAEEKLYSRHSQNYLRCLGLRRWSFVRMSLIDHLHGDITQIVLKVKERHFVPLRM